VVARTSEDCFEKKNLPFFLLEGTKHVLNTPGND